MKFRCYLIAYHFREMAPSAVHWSVSSVKPQLDDETVAVIEHEFDVALPEVNIVAAQVSALEAARIKALDDYNRTVAEINERLSKLLALEAS